MTVLDHSTLDQIFHQPLSHEENLKLSSLIERSKRKKAFSQQLALDASKLLTTSENRLNKIKDAGFVKRCWYSFTGKNQEAINQNSSDLIAMQHLAWHYLKELQEQNLIKAQSIATIRNNLSATNELLYETRGFLEQAVDKIENIDGRLGLSEWSLNIKANKRKFKSYPKTILVLYLIYDFVKTHREFDFGRKDVNHLIVLLEEMNINCDEEIRFIDFIIELLHDIEVIKLDDYLNLINLSSDEYYIDNKFINENISSQFFNALYFLSNDYNKIYDLVSDETICDSDEKFERIVSKFFGEEFDYLDSIYTFKQIIEEIVGNSVLAVNIFREQNGLDEEVEKNEDEEQQHTIENLEQNTSFDELIRKLNLSYLESTKFISKNFDIAMKSNEYSYYFDDSDFDTGFLSKLRSSVSGSATSIGRASCTSDLNSYKKEVRDFISNNRGNLSEANNIIRNYKLEEIEFEDGIDYSDIDLDTSARNENWHDQFSYVSEQIEKTLDSFLNACEIAVQQLELFENNEYDKSIVVLKKQAKKDADEQKELEKQNKKVVVLDDGKKVSINWKKLDNLPCHLEDIRFIEILNKKWLIIDSNNKFYISNNESTWESLNITCIEDHSYIDEIKIIDNTCIIFSSGFEENGFIYTSDYISWKKGTIPDGVNYSNGIYPTKNITKFKNIWLWICTKKTEYSYKEKGFFSESTKISDYKKPIIMYSSNLNSDWKEWEHTPYLDEGLEIKNLAVLPVLNIPILLTKYDWIYASNKKKIDAKPKAIYLTDNQKWRECSWIIDDIQDNAFFDQINSLYFCQTAYRESFISKNGFEWTKSDIDFSIDKIFKLQDFNIFISSSTLYLSKDMNEFKEMILEDGNWQKFSSNGEKILAIHAPSRHEEYLMLGNIIVSE
ncbi:hypothetical protein CDG60_14400 [Acinetobacter chinensis]|uniref:Uncharacterized protein n=1 Tax=Acinetobacter chinensis TaxID=2004650 RepID=A0A3B7LZ22_9GAMM|nr:hypothetical protein [Acinetobacter chinensis]AXY57648.1 hypothetical protein CDG60_14400 [Acinetobacter chinensis]